MKLMAKATSPQNIGKLISKNTQARLNPIPVNKLMMNFTLTNLMISFSVFLNALMEENLCLNIVVFSIFWKLIDSVS